MATVTFFQWSKAGRMLQHPACSDNGFVTGFVKILKPEESIHCTAGSCKAYIFMRYQ